MKAKCYENYPYWIVLISNLLQLSVYVIGAVIISQIGLVWIIPYVLYILFLEARLLRKSCVNCYYYGKFCSFGKGKLCSVFFRKGNPKKFVKSEITWKDIIPDFLVSLIPFFVGIVVLVLKFDWILLLFVVLLFLLSSFGNSFVRGTLACRYCKQRKIGCPAERLFSKTQK